MDGEDIEISQQKNVWLWVPCKLYVDCSVTHSSQPHNLLGRSIRDFPLQSQTYSWCSHGNLCVRGLCISAGCWGVRLFVRPLATCMVHLPAGLPVPPMYIEVLSLPPSSRKRKQPPRPPLGSARVQVCPVSLSLCLVVCCKVFVTSARKYPPRLLRGDSHALRPKSLNGM